MRVPFASIALAGLLACATTASAADTRAWNFSVHLDDKPIGHHRFSLSDEGARRTLTSEARFQVRILGISAYRYVHDASEEWRGNCLTALTARTDDDGVKKEVAVTRAGDTLKLTANKAEQTLPACVMTFAYWNPEILTQGRLLNPQTGEYEKVSIAKTGDERIFVRGQPVMAQRLRITGPKNPIDLWYSPEREWLALESPLEGGRRLRYVLQ
jgi:hypothetical protein